ncbi:putative mitochondrial 2-oxodicarboxylate carrier [Choanephora cucurbitarum]|uniref:Putative mitochondrial 2-oxodicarboxylate carrier n=1 Tax=Choanephora cucurbitarum TaxID=101091 RepID=A0A1C7NQG9_9FUNG|nr:putative mitochondrial 2-oxodicarboxylate carrier [Choanephora cucurbitarum]
MADNSQKPLPFGFQFLAGAIAGTSETLIMYPLDVVKTRAQLSTGANTGVIQTISTMIKQEGPASLYRGILPPIMVEAPKRATKFAANEQYTTLYKKLFGFEKVTQSLSILTGISAGITEAGLIVPFELIKVRMQDKANLGKYNGTADTFRKVIASEGVLALFNGLEATMWRHAVWNGSYFGLIFTVKDIMPKSKDPDQQRLTNFAAGTVGGIIATTFNTPFDVVKSRVQSYNGVGPKKYNWTLPALATVVREEGAASLYRGFLPKVLRLGPGGGILLVVFEAVSGFIRKNLLKDD